MADQMFNNDDLKPDFGDNMHSGQGDFDANSNDFNNLDVNVKNRSEQMTNSVLSIELDINQQFTFTKGFQGLQ